ncbi:MAG: hypothetical protein E7591_04945 [Ruminococcaceae bacterium]|nr:hypothetical protein [Oscillospiraceae bacterium]
MDTLEIKNEVPVVANDDFKVKNRKGEVVPPDKIRKTGRRVKGLPAMAKVEPFILETRVGSSNYIKDSLKTDRIDAYIKEKREKGLTNFTLMHVFVASYIRAVSQKPGINRFVQGQRVYARNNIEVCLVIKKEMSLESPDTVIKAYFYPDATAEEVYYQFEKIINDYRNSPGGDFDDTVKFFSYIPRVVMRGAMNVIKFFDYFNMLPRFLTKLSPFHGSFFITSMGSLGIPPIYHHLYDFGNVPLFLSFGTKYRKNELNDEGQVEKHSYVDYTVVTDERICDGYYFASAMKFMRSVVRNPCQLDKRPDEVKKDID